MTTDSIPEPYMQQILEEITKKQGFKRPRYEVCIGTKAGDNYVGLVYRVVVREEDGGKDAESQSFIFKAMPRSAKRREALNMHLLFKTEADMYTVVLPAYTSLMKEKGIPVKDGIYPGTAKCFAAHIGEGEEGEDVLVLDDMRPKGFTMHDRKVGLDVHHCRLVLSALARLHATSFAYEHHRPEEFKRFKELVKENLFYQGNPVGEQLGMMVSRTYDYIKDRFPESSKEYEKLKPFLDNYMDNMCALVQPDPEGGNVICHGDCWTNNLLFKYSEVPGAPKELCMLDFQISRYCSPVVDLTYVLHTSATRSLRGPDQDKLLKFYHDTLGDNLRALGCDPDQIYPWSLLQQQLQRFGAYGLGMAIMTVPLFLTNSEDVPDFDAEFEKGTEIEEMFTMIKNEQQDKEICTRISDVLEEVVALGCI